MQLTRHLSNEELSEMTFDSDQRRLRRTLDALPEWARAAADRPNAFWECQQVEIRKRIARAPQRSSTQTVTAWAGAFAMVLLAILLLRDSPAPGPPRAQSDPDQELLVAVEQSVQSGVPQALEPAAMLAEEINNSRPISRSTSRFQGEPK
jgi:hypothetical protein